VSKILFICPYPADLVPSQRFRFEQYLGQVNQKCALSVTKPFFTETAYLTFYQSGNLLSKIHAIVHSYVRRYLLLLQASRYDFIFIHREMTPAGPPIAEWILAKLLRKKIIFDFDDAIWLTDKTDESAFKRILRWRSKVHSICKWSYKISCGNSYLAAYAKQFNPNVFIIPTTIDTVNLHTRPASDKSSGENITIGWTGSRSTLKYLEELILVLQALEKKYPEVGYLIIADENPNLPLKNMTFRSWKKETEIRDLAAIDIGIMPLPDDAWTKGKCGFKALQYMAMSIPAVVSPVGVNREIVQNGVEGYWCTSHQEWFARLEELIMNTEQRKEMGKCGRQKVVERYSVVSNSANFLSLFQ
jgi:glycosyltransferase involved in cell wall biosynthesis